MIPTAPTDVVPGALQPQTGSAASLQMEATSSKQRAVAATQGLIASLDNRRLGNAKIDIVMCGVNDPTRMHLVLP